MATTIKIEPETKERLLNLDLAEKGKSFNQILGDLIFFYEKNHQEHEKVMKNYRKQMLEHKKDLKTYKKRSEEFESERQMWKRLLKWAKSKGFEG